MGLPTKANRLAEEQQASSRNPYAAPKAEAYNTLQWSTLELREANRCDKTRHKLRAMKRLHNNRTAVERGRHVIAHIADDDMTIRCTGCPKVTSLGMLSRWMAYAGSTEESRCTGVLNTRGKFIEQ